MLFKITATTLTACAITAAITYYSMNKTQQVTEKIITVEKHKGFINIDKQTLEEHIRQYTYLSSRVQKLIVDTVIEEAIRYNINPIVLYSLVNIESNFKYWITHSNVVIPIKEKKVCTNAIGACGIIWELWGDRLIESSIAETQADLYDPVINIKASAFVLSEYMKQPLLQTTKSSEESAMLRYYGVTYTGKSLNKDYLDKIETFMGGLLKDAVYKRKS